ncbi:hypothetical protein [Phenylobacterium sp.]|uniref:hypothetical protein n=1 Tax=Phenylobacterium sp. TaxID=1871053 RepID=UPI00289799E9|nr:hypothetical protein [Phenylobacterium sp.]
MEENERYRRRLKVRHHALRRLKVANVHCICGEADPVCFEADHIYRQDLDGACWAICKNCHAKRSARGWSEHPPVRPGPHDPRERLAHLLLGASDYLEFIASHLRLAAAFLLGELAPTTME